VKQFLQLAWTRAVFGIKSESSTNRLGYLWWVIEPVLQIFAYYYVFGVLLAEFRNFGSAASKDNYVLFLVCGVLPWVCFSKTVSRSVGTILNGGWLIKHVTVTKLFFPVSTFFQDFLKSLVVFVLLVVALLLIGATATTNWFLVPIIIVVQGLLTLALCILLSGIAPFFPDIRFFVPILLQITMFSSGVFYDISYIQEDLRSLFFLNPFAVLLDAYRTVFLGREAEIANMLNRLFSVAAASLLMLFVGISFVRKCDPLYPTILR
jgi:lipopolysaccharide transport system permease protein